MLKRVEIRLGWPWRPHLTLEQISVAVEASPEETSVALRELIENGILTHETTPDGSTLYFVPKYPQASILKRFVGTVSAAAIVGSWFLRLILALLAVGMVFTGAAAFINGWPPGLVFLGVGLLIMWANQRFD